MITYEQYCRLHTLATTSHLTAPQLASELGLDVRTVARYLAAARFTPRRSPPRGSRLDPFKGTVVRLLTQHPYTAAQVLQRLREEGYQGGYTVVKDFVRQVRPADRPAYLSLAFAPGECAQVDWGVAGTVPVGGTRRQLSFFVAVLCYSRLLYVEFTLSQAMEHFLTCQRHAWEFFGGVPTKVMVDNCKTAVLAHPAVGPVEVNPQYADFARHYGFRIVPCNVRAGNEKGRVEKAVDYVKKSLLNGLDLSSLAVVQAAATQWRDQVANCRVHGVTHQRPVDLFVAEQRQLQPLPLLPYDCARLKNVRADSQFRVSFEANRYSVPATYASVKQLTAHLLPEQVLLYHGSDLIAQHARCYDRHQDLEDPEHAKPLLQHKRKARDQHLFRRFLALGTVAQTYYEGLASRRFNAMDHVRRILALVDIHGAAVVGQVLTDTAACGAYSSEYVANLLEQRRRPSPVPAPLHLTRNADLLELALAAPNLALYDHPGDRP